MPLTTRSQSAAAARRRDLEARRGVLTRRENNVAPPEASSARSRKNSCAAAIGDAMSRAVKKATRGVRGKSKAVEGAGSGSGSANGDALVRDLQMRVKALEAEIERMKEAAESRAASSRARLPRDDAAPAPASRAAAEGERHIPSLCDDLLLEIFLRLPSLATLARAACTCAAWRRAVASSPDFRRRFRALHPPALLGFFTDSSVVAGSPAFVPARPHGRDPAAAVRGGDFSLTSLETPGWQVMSNSCRLGNLLLCNWEDKLLAVLNPLTRQSEPLPDLVSRNMLGGCEGYIVGAVLSSEEDPVPSRLMLVDHLHPGSKMKATIFSMDTGVCSDTPWADVPACPDQDDDHELYAIAVQLDGSVYYVLENWRYVVSIDTATMELIVIELPQCVGHSFQVGETKDGATCLVYSDGLDIGVLMHARDADGVQKWVLDTVVSMGAELQRVLPDQFAEDSALEVFAVRDGYAYLSTSVTLQDPDGNRYWFLSLCLGTMKLEKLFQGTFGCDGIPYIMPWPRSLVGNYGRLKLQA